MQSFSSLLVVFYVCSDFMFPTSRLCSLLPEVLHRRLGAYLASADTQTQTRAEIRSNWQSSAAG